MTPAELQIELGKRIQSLRLRRNFRQKDLADKAGVGLRAHVRLEAGRGSTVETLLRVLHALDLGAIGLDALAPKPAISPLALICFNRMPRRASTRRGRFTGSAAQGS